MRKIKIFQKRGYTKREARRLLKHLNRKKRLLKKEKNNFKKHNVSDIFSQAIKLSVLNSEILAITFGFSKLPSGGVAVHLPKKAVYSPINKINFVEVGSSTE